LAAAERVICRQSQWHVHPINPVTCATSNNHTQQRQKKIKKNERRRKMLSGSSAIRTLDSLGRGGDIFGSVSHLENFRFYLFFFSFALVVVVGSIV
jgi:hypothetical protein